MNINSEITQNRSVLEDEFFFSISTIVRLNKFILKKKYSITFDLHIWLLRKNNQVVMFFSFR